MGYACMETARGDIHTPNRASQLRDYSGLRYGNITPTDLDGIIEYHDKAYIIIELKHKDAPPISDGQRLCLERLTDDLASTGKQVLCIIAIHETEAHEKIDAANTTVESCRLSGRWREIKSNRLTKDLIRAFLDSLPPT